MRGLRDRNERILQMRRTGASYTEIALVFGLSKQAIGVILQGFEVEKKNFRKSNQILEAIRKADDPDRKWMVTDLLDALGLITMARNAIANYFKWRQTNEVSVRDLMDLAISEKPDVRPGYLIAPLLDLRCVGKRGFWSVVRQLTELDLGWGINREWDKRLTRLTQCSRIRGARQYSWSRPCEFPGEWARERNESNQQTSQAAASVRAQAPETNRKQRYDLTTASFQI